ncbi:hypothetical protein D3C80_1815640 [compost metagenome]
MNGAEDLEHLPGLLGAVADHHAANAGVGQRTAAPFEITNDIFEHGLDELRVGVDELAVDIALLQF